MTLFLILCVEHAEFCPKPSTIFLKLAQKVTVKD